jgi:hypothetical protein
MAYLPRKKQGQSILELALYGAILLTVIGVILSYGLKYNFQQRTMMSAFRRALKETGATRLGGQTSYILLQDRHIPDPSDPMGVGAVMPFMASASVVRGYRLHETPDYVNELPETKMQINDRIYTFKIAGFRYENVTNANYPKYEEIYGDLYVKEGTQPPDWSCCGRDYYNNCIPCGPDEAKQLKIQDSCEGQLMSYDGCKRQCRMMSDTEDGRAFCRRECERGKRPDEDKNCTDICNKNVTQPWYCSNLDNIFDFAINKPKVMGVQSDYDKRITQKDRFEKEEKPGGRIETTETIDWTDTTDRTVTYMQYGLPNPAGRREERVSSTLSERNKRATCVDGVCN